MANSASSKKRARQAIGRRTRNVNDRSMMRTCIKRVYYAIEAGEKSAAEEAYKIACPVIDRVSGKGLIHKNKASNYKNQLEKHVNAL